MRVLIKTASLGSGGIQKLLMDYQGKMNTVCYDYFLNDVIPEMYTEQAISYGSKIYGRETNDGSRLRKLWERISLFYKHLKKEKYEIVHINETLQWTAVYTLVARLAGVKVIIAHSHNDHSTDKIPFVQKAIINPLSRFISSYMSTECWTCSQIAAKWFFTSGKIKAGKVKIINNGINSDVYRYNPTIREIYREKMNLSENFVIGHIGRFSYQKNHEFILEVFKDILNIVPNSKLFLIGDGELMDKIKDYAEKLGVYENVVFYGNSKEVEKIIQTFDAFVFPSRFEGLGIVAVEAQAAAVHTFCAEETITPEINLTEYCHYLPLKNGSRYWAERIAEYAGGYEKRDTSSDIKNNNYDIVEIAKQIEDFYLSKRNKNVK